MTAPGGVGLDHPGGRRRGRHRRARTTSPAAGPARATATATTRSTATAATTSWSATTGPSPAWSTTARPTGSTRQRYGTSRTGQAKVRVAGGGAGLHPVLPDHRDPTATVDLRGDRRLRRGHPVRRRRPGRALRPGRRRHRSGAAPTTTTSTASSVRTPCSARTARTRSSATAAACRTGTRPAHARRRRTLTMPPAVTYTSRLDGSVSREADLLHDVNGTDFVGGATSAPMPLDGITYGGADRIRGGDGHDSIHAGAGDDLVNGDTGGDSVFGDRGNDVMWGGAGRACAHDGRGLPGRPGRQRRVRSTTWSAARTRTSSTGARAASTGPARPHRPDLQHQHRPGDHEEGRHDRPVLLVRDDRPRRRRRRRRRRPSPNNQHHQGVDWVYGGWDRDVMQGDLSAERPQPRRPADGLVGRLQPVQPLQRGLRRVHRRQDPRPRRWRTSCRPGPPATVPVDRPAGDARPTWRPRAPRRTTSWRWSTTATTRTTATGSAYPTTPGHFDDANACAGY